MYIANIQLITSTSLPRHDQFHCWWRFPVFHWLIFNWKLLTIFYWPLVFSYLPPNTSEKSTSSIGSKSFNNCLLNDTLSSRMQLCAGQKERGKSDIWKLRYPYFKNRIILTRGRFFWVYCTCNFLICKSACMVWYGMVWYV